MKLVEILTEKFNTYTNYNQAVKQIKQIAPHIKAAGWDVTGPSISPILNVDPHYAQGIIEWGREKGKLGDAHLGKATGNDPAERILVAIYKAAKSGGGLGLDKVAEYTGLSPEDITDVVEKQASHLKAHTKELTGKDFNPKWFAPKNATNKPIYDSRVKGSLAKAIRKTMMELTNNMSAQYLQSIPAHEIATKLNLARTTVDRELSNNPELRDLEPFRKLGKQVGTTDKDREDRHIRDKFK
jgi:hypothetical protein